MKYDILKRFIFVCLFFSAMLIFVLAISHLVINIAELKTLIFRLR